MSWDQIYDFFYARDFIYFISSPSIQDALFGVKLVFIFFTVFFLCAVIYFYLNSSYLQYQFLEDVTEFFSWQAYGLRQVDKRWRSIVRKTESGAEEDYKLAIVEADDFLYQTMESGGFAGETFEELVESAAKKMQPGFADILQDHQIRNSIVYEPNYMLDLDDARRTLLHYETAIKNLALV